MTLLFAVFKIISILAGLFLLALFFFRGAGGNPGQERLGQGRRTACVIFMVLLYLFFRGIGDHGLLDPIEGTNASVALDMAMRRNFSVPMVDGHLYAGNSMGFWWLSAFSLSLFGWSEFAVRLWPVLGGLGMAAAGWFIALRAGGERAANYAAVMVGSSLIVYVSSQLASPHSLYAFFVTASLLGTLYALKNERFFILTHAAAAGAFVIYGSAGLALPWLALLAYGILAGQERFFLRALFYWPGLLATALIGGGYVVFLKLNNPYLLTLMLRGVPGDAFTSLTAALVFLALGFFPWVGALPWAVKNALPHRWGFTLPSERHSVLLLVWIAVFVFFGVFAKDALVLTAAFPAVGALCACHLAQAAEDKNTPLLQKFAAMEIVLLVPFLLIALPCFFIFSDRTLRRTLMSVIPWGIFCLLFLLAAWRYARARHIRKMILRMGLLALFSLLPLAGVFDLLGESFSMRGAGLHIRSVAKPGDLLVQYAMNNPSLHFYVGKTGESLLIRAPGNPKIMGENFAEDGYLNRIWAEKRRVFLIIGRYQEVVSPLPRIVYNLHEARDKIVLSNLSGAEAEAP